MKQQTTKSARLTVKAIYNIKYFTHNTVSKHVQTSCASWRLLNQSIKRFPTQLVGIIADLYNVQLLLADSTLHSYRLRALQYLEPQILTGRCCSKLWTMRKSNAMLNTSHTRPEHHEDTDLWDLGRLCFRDTVCSLFSRYFTDIILMFAWLDNCKLGGNIAFLTQ